MDFAASSLNRQRYRVWRTCARNAKRRMSRQIEPGGTPAWHLRGISRRRAALTGAAKMPKLASTGNRTRRGRLNEASAAFDLCIEHNGAWNAKSLSCQAFRRVVEG